MRSRLRWLLVALGLVAACGRMPAPAAPAAAGAGPHVYLVVVDGLGADLVDRRLMPHLFDAGLEPVALRTESRAVMPTRTNPNHATLLSGLLPDGHGVTGNAYWNRKARSAERLEAAGLLEAETLFTVGEVVHPELVTIAAFSKAKLGRMFEAVPDRQRGPDVLWVPADGGLVGHVTGVASDADTMDAFLAASASREPDLAAINLSEVDRAAHERGPSGTAEARRHADAAIGRLVADLHARGRWERSILIVTADHGFDDVAPGPERADPVVVLSREFARAGVAGVHVVGDGGVAHVYADGVTATATAVGDAATMLSSAAAVARRLPGVAEVLARLPVPGVPLLERVHPDWGLAHERTGELLVVAAGGYELVDPPDPFTTRFRGNHGSPREQPVPLVVAGGAVHGIVRPGERPPTSADVGATIGALLGLPAPRRFDGAPAHEGEPLPLAVRAASPSH